MKLSGMPKAAIVSVAGALAFAAWSCGGSSPITSPITTPSTTPSTMPSSSPSQDPVTASCPLGKGDVNARCGAAAPHLLAPVQAAIDALVAHRPELFNKQEEAGANTRQYRVLDKDAYLDGIVSELQAADLCAERTIDLERVQVKSTNGFSEEWDVISSSRYIRRGTAGYRSTCSPAAFPLDAADYIAEVRTSLWAYECFMPGVTPPPPGDAKIPVGCDGRVTATPKFKDGTNVPARIHGPNVLWELREGPDVVRLETDPRFPNEPFDKVLVTSGKLGYFYVCATVKGKTGCLHGQTIP
jgi:hypothetical protein